MITVNAAMEQMSSGQIGQPAACIIENKRALSCGGSFSRASPRADYGVRIVPPFRARLRLRAARRATSKSGIDVVHRSRGQLCGQPGGGAALRQRRRDADQIAEELSRKKLFHINDLVRRPAVCTGILRQEASNGAPVELSGRACAGFADD
ncbi:MAG: hypothetical protein M3Y55_18265 [Pseudomonadota bacterium]|nr:hypothetical protein [Pseudomonadota bacterium]MDQ2763542.1 hypothetical protein [Pseudomonadota bacterium]